MNSPHYISPHFQKVHYPSSSIRDFRAAEGLNGGQVGDPVELVNVTKTAYQYKYNGKEWQDELGLNMYAMDMRQYDPAIARWVVQDPIDHFYQSTYSAFEGNPVFWADPSGAAVEETEEGWTFAGDDAKSLFSWLQQNLKDEEKQDCNNNEKERKSDKNNLDYDNCPRCWWLNDDEYLTPDEAIWHYRLGNGEPVSVRLNKLDLSKVRVRDFKNTPYNHQGYPMIYVNFDQEFYTNFDQAIIYGSIALVYIGNNTVMALPDTYDFDMKYNYSTAKGVIRDLGTLMGLYWNGAGTPYDIQFLGTAKIKE